MSSHKMTCMQFLGVNIFCLSSHEKRSGKGKMLCYSLLPYNNSRFGQSDLVICNYTTHLACFHWYRRAQIILEHATSFACGVPWMTFYFGEIHNRRTHGPLENDVDVHAKGGRNVALCLRAWGERCTVMQMTPPSPPGTENPGKHGSPDFILFLKCLKRW